MAPLLYDRFRRFLAMHFFKVASSFSLLVLAVAIGGQRYRDALSSNACHAQCRNIPGDASWPSQTNWRALNQSLDGRLIATIPIGAQCHNSFTDSTTNITVSMYDQDRCNALRDVWFYPETHLESPSSPMAYPFSNYSCDPFLEPDSPCTIGYHATYSINVTGPRDIQEGIRFSREHNIRLVIRNTGHDYLGKSTGAHSLALWTNHLKSISLIEEYHGPNYSGPAIKIGAGVEGLEAYEFANAHGLIVVGGNCPTVGIAGGYTQGGGHGPFASKYGLSADQVLEWEVITGTGELLTATSTNNPDLFWALRGGGGGTFGVVVSMTVKAFPDNYFSTAYITALNNGSNADSIYSALGTFLHSLPSVVDAGVAAVWVAAPFGFMLMPAFAPELHQDEVDKLLKPTLDKMDALGLDYQYSSSEFPTFLSAYNSLTSTWNVSDYNIGGRLIPRDLVSNNLDGLVEAIRYISSQTLMSGVTFNVKNGVPSADDVAVNPYFRKTLFSATVGTTIDYASAAANQQAQDALTNDLLPALEKVTPNGAAYLNEADFQQPDFQSTFYGAHYERLLSIKRKYDPEDIFYAVTAVGSDHWKEDVDGRLCKVQ